MRNNITILLLFIFCASANLNAGGRNERTLLPIPLISIQNKETVPELVDTTLYASTIRYVFSAGTALPVGVYGATKGENASFAKTGTHVNFDFLFPVQSSIFVSLSLAYHNNGTDNEAFRSKWAPASVTSVLGDWAFLWALPGIRLEHPAGPVTLFGGLNYGSVAIQSASVSIIYPYTAPSTSAVNTRVNGLRIDAGAYMDDLYSFGIQYYYTRPQLPKNAMATVAANGGSISTIHFTDKDLYHQPISILCISCGFRF
jgi:hypothetical protein